VLLQLVEVDACGEQQLKLTEVGWLTRLGLATQGYIRPVSGTAVEPMNEIPDLHCCGNDNWLYWLATPAFRLRYEVIWIMVPDHELWLPNSIEAILLVAPPSGKIIPGFCSYGRNKFLYPLLTL